MASWRLIRDGAHSGPFNMGVDEALLRAAATGGLASLRFYSWRGPWLSLGHTQSVSAERLEACRGAGVGVLRRVTGGRAVLHGQDLTYAIAAPESLLPQGLQASYERIGAALLAALRDVGLDAELVSASSPNALRSGYFDCFEVPVSGEICVAGRKIAGNAQRRAGGAVLQHGSIRLTPDPSHVALAAGQRPGSATSIRESGCLARADVLVPALERAFARVLGASFVSAELDLSCTNSGFARERIHQAESLPPSPNPMAKLKRPISAADNR